ncbi:hypothetical protein GCM10008937_27350 [Deinococcus depolymerans]|uniref:Uncharacterized protein n=1 Tax=Deinococcus depolymerans TaxID=392408 RepID=A0ABN1CHI8_9DEIO
MNGLCSPFNRSLYDFAPGWGLRLYATPHPPGFEVMNGPRSARPVSTLLRIGLAPLTDEEFTGRRR